MSSKHKATGTWRIKPNGNKSVAVGNVLLSEAFFRKYGLDREISKLKAKGIDLSKLAELMVAYKLGDNFSIFKAHEFIMEPVIRERFGLDEFNVKTLYRAVERLGQNRGGDRFRFQAEGAEGIRSADIRRDIRLDIAGVFRLQA